MCSQTHHCEPRPASQEQNVKISVVIPTLNAAATLAATLDALGSVDEIVIADGGSVDGTVEQARYAGVRVVIVPKGRGQQLAGGIEAANRQWLLLLHADTRLTSDWQAEAAAHMRANPDKAAY